MSNHKASRTDARSGLSDDPLTACAKRDLDIKCPTAEPIGSALGVT
jgi:hypothetical protein